MPWELKDAMPFTPREKTRRRRIMLLGAAGASVALALVGLLMAVPFMVRRDLSSGSSFQLGDLRGLTEIVIESDGSYEVTLQFADALGVAVDPRMLGVSLAMEGHTMQPDPVPLVRTATGAYRGEGQLTTAGRWRFNVTSDQGAVDMVATYANSF